MKPLLSASCLIKVHFHDVDPMNVVWHGNYMKYFEAARSALFDKLNYNYPQMQESEMVWPVVDMHIKYKKPIALHQEIEIEAHLMEYENRMKINFVILDKETKKILTTAQCIHVAVCAKSSTLQFSTPKVFQEKVKSLISGI